MKRLLVTIFVLLCLSLFNSLLAATYMDGYVVKDGDTIRCKIKTWSTGSGLNQLTIQEDIITKDSAGNEVKYLPTEIQGFGFMYGKEQMTFIRRVLSEGEKPIFMRVVLLGKKLNLFRYDVPATSTFYSPSGGFSSIASYSIVYVIEDEQKRTVLFDNSTKSRKQMKEFFSDDPELLKLYLYKRPNIHEIPDFVFIANKG